MRDSDIDRHERHVANVRDAHARAEKDLRGFIETALLPLAFLGRDWIDALLHKRARLTYEEARLQEAETICELIAEARRARTELAKVTS